MSENIYELGDEFEGGPAEISRWITEVTSKGYDFHLSKEGVLTIISVPENKKKSEAKAPVAPVMVEAPVEDLSAVEEAVVVVEDFKEVVVEEPVPKTTPKPRGRKPKAIAPETTEE